MELILWFVVIIIFLYTSGFAVSLWKQKNKFGAIAVMGLSLATLVMQYFTNLR